MSPTRPGATSRVIRPDEPMPKDDDWADQTMAERLEAVWSLTRTAYGWTHGDAEPRMDKSVVRVIRPRG